MPAVAHCVTAGIVPEVTVCSFCLEGWLDYADPQAGLITKDAYRSETAMLLPD